MATVTFTVPQATLDKLTAAAAFDGKANAKVWVKGLIEARLATQGAMAAYRTQQDAVETANADAKASVENIT
jgi:hypothetical protein